MPRTLAQLLAAPVAGNAYNDLALWHELDAYILDGRHSIEDRAKASRKVAEITGEPFPGNDYEQVLANVRVLNFAAGRPMPEAL